MLRNSDLFLLSGMESWSYDIMSTSDSFSRMKMPWRSEEDPKAQSSFGNVNSDSGLLPVDNQGLGLMGYQDVMSSSSKVHGGKIFSPYTGLEDESSSRLSSSIVDSDRFDLQLGVFGDPIDSQKNSRVAPRRTMMGANCNVAYCQVYGCNKDLSVSKDYHKRHKVCEAHSKTARVIVNGIEQRFCQQCSRFHLLAEFDDGKRSCRKRLAGHNQRRRKPQVGFHSGRSSRLLQAYNAGPFSGFDNGRFHGAALSSCSHLSAGSMSNGNLPSRLLFPYSNGTGGVFAENSSRYLHNLGAPDGNSRSWIADSSLANNGFPAFDAGLSGITYSGCALSLLSSQSNNSTNHSSGMHIARPILIPESNGVINFDIADGIYQGPHVVNEKDQFWCEAGGTINLLQLSSQLQRVECEKQSMQVKQETNAFC